MSGFCGDSVCAARVLARRMLPDDDAIADPCPRCLAALGDRRLAEEDFARTLRSVHSVIVGRL